MRKLMNSFSAWARMQNSENESVRVVDGAITVVGTLLVAIAWVMVKR